MATLFGIKNCDTMKKAFAWLEAQNIAYTFHDYKKQGADKAVLEQALKENGWEIVINRRGTTWRQLPDDIKDNMNADQAVDIALENPSIIKRPLLLKDDKTYIGFKAENYAAIFK